MNRSIETILKQKQKAFVSQINTLNALSPLKVMERGFSIAYNENEKIIKSINDVEVGESITVSLSDGTVESKVIARKEGNNNE